MDQNTVILQAARSINQRPTCPVSDKESTTGDLCASELPSEHLPIVQSLVDMSAEVAEAHHVAVKLLQLEQQFCSRDAAETHVEQRLHEMVEAATAAEARAGNRAQLLRDCQLKQSQLEQYMDAVKKQHDALERAYERRREENYRATLIALLRKPAPARRWTTVQPKQAHEASTTFPSTYLGKAEQCKRGTAAADRKALPAAAYYSIMDALLQHRQDLLQMNMDAHLQHLKQDLQIDPAKAAQAADTKSTTGHRDTALQRLSNLCCLMQHRVAPYHLAMGPYELLLAALQSIPWLCRCRSQLQLFEEAELGVLMHRWVQQKQAARDLIGRAKVGAAVDMSRAARRQLLRSFTRHILAADDPQVSSSSPAQQSSRTWKGISWALFPDGTKRELGSLTDRWRSCPDVSVMTQQQCTLPQQLRAGSATASYIREVRAYSTSPYPKFEELLGEELRSSISAHHLQRIMAAGRASSSPAAAAGFRAAGP